MKNNHLMHTGIKQTNYQPSACTHTFTLSFSRSGIWIKEAYQVASPRREGRD